MARLAPILSLVALVLAIGYFEFRLPASTSPPAPAPAPDLSGIESRLAALERRIAAAETAAARPAPAPEAPPARPATPSGPGAPPSPAPAAERAALVDDLLVLAKEGRLTGEQVSSLWNLLPGSGREDAAIAALKAYAAAHPDDPDAQYAVGVALISKLVGGQVSFLEQGALSSQADAAFGKALALDESHFDARYSRAVSLTFWPDAFGKGPDAIREFEFLRERHRADAGIPTMESVYANLVVQYRKAGNAEKAAEVLKEGLATFPDSETLKKFLGDAGR